MMIGMTQETRWEKLVMQEKEKVNLEEQAEMGYGPHRKAHH